MSARISATASKSPGPATPGELRVALVNRLTRTEAVRELLLSLLERSSSSSRPPEPGRGLMDLQEVYRYREDLSELVDRVQSDREFESLRPAVNLAAVMSGVRGKDSFNQLGRSALERIRADRSSATPTGAPIGSDLSTTTSAYVMILASASGPEDRARLIRELTAQTGSPLEKAALSSAQSYLKFSER